MDKYLKALGIKELLTLEEIKKIHREKSLKYHPDRNPGFKEESEYKMKEINIAYDYIKNNYDIYLNYIKSNLDNNLVSDKNQEEDTLNEDIHNNDEYCKDTENSEDFRNNFIIMLIISIILTFIIFLFKWLISLFQ